MVLPDFFNYSHTAVHFVLLENDRPLSKSLNSFAETKVRNPYDTNIASASGL